MSDGRSGSTTRASRSGCSATRGSQVFALLAAGLFAISFASLSAARPAAGAGSAPKLLLLPVLVHSAEDPTYLRASFDSAWAPPEGAIRKIALDFPDLTFRLEYAEGGCDFSGVLCLKGDEELECWTGSFRERPEAFQWDEEEEDATV